MSFCIPIADSNDRMEPVENAINSLGSDLFDSFLLPDQDINFSAFLTLSPDDLAIDSSTAASPGMLHEQAHWRPGTSNTLRKKEPATFLAMHRDPDHGTSVNVQSSERELSHPEIAAFYLPKDFQCSQDFLPLPSGSPTIERQLWKQRRGKYSSKDVGEHKQATGGNGLCSIRKAASLPNFESTGLSGVDDWHDGCPTTMAGLNNPIRSNSFLLSPPPSAHGGHRATGTYDPCSSIDPRVTVGSSSYDASQEIFSMRAIQSDQDLLPQTCSLNYPYVSRPDHIIEMTKTPLFCRNLAGLCRPKIQSPLTPGSSHKLYLQKQSFSSNLEEERADQCNQERSISNQHLTPRGSVKTPKYYEPDRNRQNCHAFQVRKCKSSKSLKSNAPRNGQYALDFVNYTPNDSHKILTGVAPSGSSKTKARREKEALEKRFRLSQAAIRAVQAAGGDVTRLLEEGLCERGLENLMKGGEI